MNQQLIVLEMSGVDLINQTSLPKRQKKSLINIKNNANNLFILDLLDLQNNENFYDYFLECDGHWNLNGNKMAADYVFTFTDN